MKLITKQHSGNGYKQLIKVHKKNGSYNIDVKDDNSKMPKVTIHTDVLKDLLQEQGYICAYCMRKIDEDNATIEHIIGQQYKDSSDKAIGKIEDTNYSNMLAVCCGNSCQDDLHCDKSRARVQTTRPLLFVSPLNSTHMTNIKFSQSGVIYYKELECNIDKAKESEEDKEIRYDINKVLNLNCRNLVEQRGRIIHSIKSILKRYKFDKTKVKSELVGWQQPNSGYKEFAQVAIYELQKHI